MVFQAFFLMFLSVVGTALWRLGGWPDGRPGGPSTERRASPPPRPLTATEIHIEKGATYERIDVR